MNNTIDIGQIASQAASQVAGCLTHLRTIEHDLEHGTFFYFYNHREFRMAIMQPMDSLPEGLLLFRSEATARQIGRRLPKEWIMERGSFRHCFRKAEAECYSTIWIRAEGEATYLRIDIKSAHLRWSGPRMPAG